MKIYRAHVDGFVGHFTDLTSLRAWVLTKHGVNGKVLKIWQGAGTTACATYLGAALEIVVQGAAS